MLASRAASLLGRRAAPLAHAHGAPCARALGAGLPAQQQRHELERWTQSCAAQAPALLLLGARGGPLGLGAPLAGGVGAQQRAMGTWAAPQLRAVDADVDALRKQEERAALLRFVVASSVVDMDFDMMNRNNRSPKKANRGKRPCSRVRRRKKWRGKSLKRHGKY